MSVLFHPYDITREEELQEPLDFLRRSRLKNVDQVFKAEITSVIDLTETEKLFHVRVIDPVERERFTFLPGQFVMIEVPGFGEIPISISGSASQKGFIELCIRRAGLVTGVLHRAVPGARVGLRGPFGTNFPVEQMKGNNLLLVAGGLGLAPLRSAILYATENRADFERIEIIYGTSHPSKLLFDYQYEQWRRVAGVKLSIIVDEADDDWAGPVGMITELLPGVGDPSKDTYAVVCGPPVMFKYVCNWLSEQGMPMQRMFVSLERRMHCGMGKCCRCNVGSTYTCIDGPVFDYWTVMNLKEAIEALGAMKYLGLEPKRPRIAVFDFTCCEGCELQFANKEETLLDFLGAVEVIEFREISSARGGEYDIAFIEGSISRSDEIDRLLKIRRRATALVELGSCACFGGVNRLKNAHDLNAANKEVYGDQPKETLPVRAVHELVPVDLSIPGCPVNKTEVERIVQHLVWDVPFAFPAYPVCLECKQRYTVCVMDQGQLCLGPITKAGCDAPCPASGLGCWGCRGPAEEPNFDEFFAIARRHGFAEQEIDERLAFFGGFEDVR